MTRAQGPAIVTYPNRSATPENTFTQETLNRLTATVLSWRQSPGAVGGLNLHSCWAEASVLTRRYQGQSAPHMASLLTGALKLYDHTGVDSWKSFARDIASNLLFLQAPEGGFIHAANEFEPAYTCRQTCPIAQGLPALALIEYAAWEHADSHLVDEIEDALVHFWSWMYDFFWLRGNTWRGRLSTAGWCGVTNQDLVVAAAMARYGEVFGDWRQYHSYGKPTLEALLKPDAYYPGIGLFERGDASNSVERTSYYGIILSMLKIIEQSTGNSGLGEVIANVAAHLFDAIFVDPDGNTHLAWGAVTYPGDKDKVLDWIPTPNVITSYPELIVHMREHLNRHPDDTRSVQLERLETTLAHIVFADGTLPCAVGASDPLFTVVPAQSLSFWLFLIERLGDNVSSPSAVGIPTIRRTRGSLTHVSNEDLWEIRNDGGRLFGGLKSEPTGIIHGDEESLYGVDFSSLNDPDIIEEWVLA